MVPKRVPAGEIPSCLKWQPSSYTFVIECPHSCLTLIVGLVENDEIRNTLSSSSLIDYRDFDKSFCLWVSFNFLTFNMRIESMTFNTQVKSKQTEVGKWPLSSLTRFQIKSYTAMILTGFDISVCVLVRGTSYSNCVGYAESQASYK